MGAALMQPRSGPIFALLTVVVLLSSVANAGAWAAVSFSEKDQKSYLSWNSDSEAAAKSSALQTCNASDCVVVLKAQNEYVAISANTDLTLYGYGHDKDRATAVLASYKDCLTKATVCHWQTYVHSTGEAGTESAIQREKSAQNAKLSDLGGSFSKTILNFVGIKQQHDHWCWAAAVETIFLSITGAHLDQGKLASIQDPHTSFYHPSDFSKVTPLIVDLHCTGANTDQADCDHGGYAQLALEKLGLSPAFVTYPNPDNAVMVYKTIRESLSRNVPIGMTIGWYTHEAHAVVIYGADFKPSRKVNATVDTPAEITLKIFDPFDGHYYRIQSTAYLPSYEKVPGELSNWLSIADYRNPSLHQVRSQTCEFLTESDRAKFCPSLLRP